MQSYQLTAIEKKILWGLATGLQSKELASYINRSVPTVEITIRRLYTKMSAKSRAHLVAIAFTTDIIKDCA